MITQTVVLSRQVATLCAVLGVFGAIAGCHARVLGKLPPCPAPSDAAIADVGEMIEENQENPPRFGNAILWISEVERFCAAVLAYRTQ